VWLSSYSNRTFRNKKGCGRPRPNFFQIFFLRKTCNTLKKKCTKFQLYSTTRCRNSNFGCGRQGVVDALYCFWPHPTICTIVLRSRANFGDHTFIGWACRWILVKKSDLEYFCIFWKFFTIPKNYILSWTQMLYIRVVFHWVGWKSGVITKPCRAN